jgi:acetyl-CoA carboxylase biotin carboxyl carrier protein
MEMENIIKLIKTVSDSNLTSFEYTEGNISLSLKADRSVTYMDPSEIPSSRVLLDKKPADLKQDTNNLIIKSPMVGVFYAAKSEDSEPYIAVGDVIKKGQIIGIVEAMKLMNEIESAYDGVVESILVNNKDIVEYGQELVVIRPM